MSTQLKALDSWYIQHPRLVRLLMVAFVVMVILMPIIGFANPAHAAVPSDIIGPPKGGDVTFPDVVVLWVSRIFATFLSLAGLAAAIVFSWNLFFVLWALISTRNTDTLKKRGRNLILTAIIGGITLGGGYAIFNGTAELASKVFG